MKNYKYFIFAVLVIGVGYLGFGITKKNLTGGGGGEAKPTVAPTAVPKPNYPTTLGSFLVTDKEVCLEDGKPLVYFFGFSSCSHCVWEKPIAKKVFDKFKGKIAYHENFDVQTDSDVFEKYQDINPGYVPFLILGCKYARMGSGESLAATPEASKSLEEEALTAITCKLTDNQPAAVCNPLKDKILEIK